MMSPLIVSPTSQNAAVQNAAGFGLLTGSAPLSLFLPTDLQSEQVAELLDRLVKKINQIDPETPDSELRAFVQWALKQSYSDQLTHLERMQLLDLAWQVQKLLWSPSRL